MNFSTDFYQTSEYKVMFDSLKMVENELKFCKSFDRLSKRRLKKTASTIRYDLTRHVWSKYDTKSNNVAVTVIRGDYYLNGIDRKMSRSDICLETKIKKNHTEFKLKSWFAGRENNDVRISELLMFIPIDDIKLITIEPSFEMYEILQNINSFIDDWFKNFHK